MSDPPTMDGLTPAQWVLAHSHEHGDPLVFASYRMGAWAAVCDRFQRGPGSPSYARVAFWQAVVNFLENK